MFFYIKIYGVFGRCCWSDFVIFDGFIDFKIDFSGFCVICILFKFNIFGSIEYKYEFVWNYWIFLVLRNEIIFLMFKLVDVLLINFFL